MEILKLRARWPEAETFSLFRADTGDETIFIHMLSPAELYTGEKWERVLPGACLFSAPHTAQGIRAAGAPILHDWFHVTGDISALLGQYGLSCGVVYYPPDDGVLTHDVEKAELESVSGAPFAGELCALRIESMIAHLGQALLRGVPKESPYLYPAFVQARAEILLHYDRAPRVEEMAASLSLSPSRFHKLYRAYFGISPAKDVSRTRTEHACRLLLQPNMSITEAAEQLGYGSVYLFIRRFRAETGQTPGAYRRARLGKDGEGTPGTLFEKSVPEPPQKLSDK